MNVADDCTYPAFAFVFGGRSVVIVNGRQFFDEVTPSQLRSGFFDTPFDIVDSALTRWVIQHVASPQGGFLTTLVDTITNRTVPIAVTGRRAETMSLESVKANLSRAIIEDPTGIWTGREESPEELIELVRRASDVREMFAALAWPKRT